MDNIIRFVKGTRKQIEEYQKKNENNKNTLYFCINSDNNENKNK